MVMCLFVSGSCAGQPDPGDALASEDRAKRLQGEETQLEPLRGWTPIAHFGIVDRTRGYSWDACDGSQPGEYRIVIGKRIPAQLTRVRVTGRTGTPAKPGRTVSTFFDSKKPRSNTFQFKNRRSDVGAVVLEVWWSGDLDVHNSSGSFYRR